MSPTLGRRLADARAKAMGRQALRFQLEVTPYGAANLSEDVKQASFAWERGAKLQFTAPATKGPEGSVQWSENLKQVSTLYKDGNHFAPKEYYFKVQSVDKQHSHKPSTIGKCKVNLAQYCSCGPADSQDLHLSLKPRGILNVKVRTLWLPNSQPEQDTMTDISCLSLGNTQSLASSIEQDLGGFNSPPESPVKSRGPTSPRGQLGLILESDESISRSTPTASDPAALAPGQLEAAMQLQAMSSDAEDDISPMSSAVNSPRAQEHPAAPPPAIHLPSGLVIQPPSPSGRNQAGGAQSPHGSSSRRHSTAGDTSRPQSAGRPASVQAPPQAEQPAQQMPLAGPSAGQQQQQGQIPDIPTGPATLNASTPQGASMAPAALEDLEGARGVESGSSTPTSGGHGAVHRSRWRIPARQPSKERLVKHEGLPDSAGNMPAGLKPDEKALWARVEALARTKDVEGLARYCKELPTKRQVDTMTRSQSEQRIQKLQQENSGLGAEREQMVEQLQSVEQQLQRSQSADIISELVTAKILAADKDYLALELQGLLYKEQAKVRLLLNRLTNLEAEYHGLKNRAYSMPGLWRASRSPSLKVETN